VNHGGSFLRRSRDCLFRADVGLYEGGRTPLMGVEMEYAIAGITAIFLFIYLLYALLRPERF